MKNLIIFDLDGVVTSEEAYWDCAGLTLHELLFSPRYWQITHWGDELGWEEPTASTGSTYRRRERQALSVETDLVSVFPNVHSVSFNVRVDGSSYQPATMAQESRVLSRMVFPEWLILSFKARSLNSNWDTCYAAVCLHLIALLASLPDHGATLQPFAPWDTAWLASLRAQIVASDLADTWDILRVQAAWRIQHPFDLPVFHGATGLELFECLDTYASETLGYLVEGVFSRHKLFWRFCRDLFQEWFLGEALYSSTYGHAPTQTGKPGCIFFEEPLLPVEQTRAVLAGLCEAGYTLGIASGRVKQEAEQPLAKYDLLRFFDEQHRGTYDVVTRAEKVLRAQGDTTMLGKPHPFQFQAAVDYERALGLALGTMQGPLGIPFIAVGDSTSDILSGRAAGGLTVAVLTGARSPEARELLLKSQPDFVIEDITKLPALLEEIGDLATIQQLQFERREVAEKLLHLWFTKHMNLVVEHVRLTPKPVSLNSFNGFYQSNGEEYFFKTHVEAHGVLDEYYHSKSLDQAGYNVVRPLHLLREKERQMVIYPVVHWPVMFDLMRAVETGQELPAGIHADTLMEAERVECTRLLQLYAQTFQSLEKPPLQLPPIHQLFWHRLSGERFQQFYVSKMLPLPTGSRPQALSFAEVQECSWTINGVEQTQTLGELVQQARETLDPTRETATIIGHGDAHFGNVFLEDTGEKQRYLYFDPAFAGRHAPLLDVVKPLYHNVFAMWMYFTQEVARDLQLSVKMEGARLIVEHNYRLTPIRRALLQVKQEALLQPLVAWLREQDALPDDWQTILNLALMCCPLLTVDPFDQQKRPAEIGWLGLTQAVQLGNRGIDAWKEQSEQ
ncbi:MAG: HAD hydrolase-like protein [Ktedonobacteraceae bacterium]